MRKAKDFEMMDRITIYVDVNGDRRYIYSSDLLKLRQMEEEILKDKEHTKSKDSIFLNGS